MSIAYITQSYPTLTTTFIYREVLALQRVGFEIVTFAIWKPNLKRISPESRPLVNSTAYVFPASTGNLLKAQWRFMIKHPVKYFSTAFFVLTRRGESLKNRKRTLFHFIEAVYLTKAMKQQGVEHIHAHFTINAASIALILSRLLNITFSFTAHNIFFTDRLLLKEKVREARFIVAISEFSRQYLNELVPGTYLHKMRIVHCGLSLQSFAPPKDKPNNNPPVILFVAQLVERKGAPYLLEACRILFQRGIPFKCIIIGGGQQKLALEEKLKQYNLQQRVELKGPVFQKDLKPYLNACDIFALPCITAANGDMDGVPVSLMEAMAMEIPVVSTKLSGIPELIEDGKEGLLTPEKDAAALADALQRLLQNKTLRNALGKKGRQKIIAAFDVDKNAQQLASLFQRYLA